MASSRYRAIAPMTLSAVERLQERLQGWVATQVTTAYKPQLNVFFNVNVNVKGRQDGARFPVARVFEALMVVRELLKERSSPE
jgi:hypothetical protein